MFTILIALFVIGWAAVAVIGTQAYFLGEQSKPIHERNWSSSSFESLAKSVTGKDIDSDRRPGFAIDTYAVQNLPTA
jgi:hypothetical protein